MKPHCASQSSGTSCGVGLVEILVAVAISGVLLAVATPSLADFMERRRVVAAAGELNSLITFAKSETNVIDAAVSLHLEDDPSNQMSCAAIVTHAIIDTCKCYLSQVCPVGGGGAKLLRLFQLPRDKGVQFTATASTWGSSYQRVTFARNERYQSAKNVKLTVTGQRTGAQLIVKMNEAGLVSTCSPVGRLGGFPTC